MFPAVLLSLVAFACASYQAVAWPADTHAFPHRGKLVSAGVLRLNLYCIGQRRPTAVLVMKGGSFLCSEEYCSRYMSGGRGKGDINTGTNHLGFRCVRSAK